MRGKLIVFEGVEGSGKTTQIQRLRQWLSDSGWLEMWRTHGLIPRVVVTREPGGTELGLNLRKLLLNQPINEPLRERAELLLYAADRAQHVDDFLKPELAKGCLILCDRFTDSTIAYQGYGGKMNLKLIEEVNNLATNGLESDLTLWLDINVEIGLARTKTRGNQDSIEKKKMAFHRRVQQGFTELAKANPQKIFRIDANLSEEEVENQIQQILEKKFREWGLDFTKRKGR